MKRFFALFLIVAVGVAFADDDAIWVAKDDPNAGDTAIAGRGTEALPYRTIQAAVNAALEEATIKVKPGVYDEGETVTTECYDPATNRVYISKTVNLVSTEGAARTTILGVLSNSHPTAPQYHQYWDSVRCLYIAKGGSNTVVRGFTLANGATIWAGDGGGGMYAPYGGYLVDCVVSNCYATCGGGIRGGTAVRTEFLRCGGRGGEQSAEAYDAKLWNCVVFHTGGSRALYNCDAVNCTVVATVNPIGYENCNLYNLLSLSFYYNPSYGSTGSENTSTCPTVQNCALTKNGVNLVQCLNPFLRDYRLISDRTTVLETGDAQYLESVIALPASIERTDFYGNDLSGLTGSIAAGACQSTVTPAYGGVQNTTSLETSTLGGVSIPPKGYVFATSWPVRWELVPGSTTTTVKFDRYVNGASTLLPLIPTLDGKISIVPPHDSSKLLTLYRYSVGKNWTTGEWFEYWVDAVNGDDETADGTEAKPYKTLQVGMDALYALAGYQNAVLHVRPGVYDTGGATAGGLFNRLVVRGFQFCRIVADEGPDKTFIVGSSNGVDNTRCVYSGGQHYYVQGFTLKNGRSVSETDDNAGRGAAFFNGYIRDGIVSNCVASGYLTWSTQSGYSANAARTRFIGNRALNINPARTSNANWAFCVFDGNVTTGPLVADSYAPRLFNCTFCNNDTGSSLLTGWATVYPNNCIIDANGGKVGFNVAVSVQAPSILWNYVIAQGSMPPYMFEADPQLLRADRRDYHPLATSPAAGAGEPWLDASVINEAYLYLDADLYGTHFSFTSEGKMHLGAVQSDFLTAYSITDDANGLEITGGQRGVNALAKGETVTLKITQAEDSYGRVALGVAVTDYEGIVTTNLFADLHGGMWTHTISDAASSVKVCAVYEPNVYIDAVNGNNAYDGLTAATAKKTLSNNGLVLVEGDVVHVAPGTYDSETNAYSTIVARVVIPEGVSFVASGARDETVITGTSSPAVRGVCMLARSRLEGFTLTGGPSSGYDGSCIYAPTVNVESYRPRVVDCTVTCPGYCLSGIYQVTAYRCLVSAPSVFSYATSGSHLHSCRVVATGSGHPCNGGTAWNTTVRPKAGGSYCAFVGSPKCYNSIVIGYTTRAGIYKNCLFATNAQWLAGGSSSVYSDPSGCTDCTFTTVEALALDADLRPTSLSTPVVDKALNAWVPTDDDGRSDVLGAPRIGHYVADFGAYEYHDYRSEIKALVGRSVSSIDWYSSNTVVTAEGEILMDGDGALLEMTKRSRSGLETSVTMTGSGVLSLLVNGVTVDTLASTGTIRASEIQHGDKVAFSYSGTGTALFGKLFTSRGFVLFWK